MVHEARRRDDGHLAALDVRLVDHAPHAAEVIGVRMRIDHGQHRAFAELLRDQGERRGRGLPGGERVEDDPAAVALDEADVGEVEAAHLVDASGHDLVEPEAHVGLGLALQRRMDAVVAATLRQKVVARHVPDDTPLSVEDLPVGRRRDEAAPRLFQVTRVAHGQAGSCLLVARHGGRRGRLAG